MRVLTSLLLPLALLGCISVPDDVRAEFAAPDGLRPNNFGQLEAGVVQPDRPTIPPARPTQAKEDGS